MSKVCYESDLKIKIEALHCFTYSVIDPGKISVEDLIFEKMVVVKHMNIYLHLKLYM